MPDPAPFRRLSQRLAGQPADELCEGVPDHLDAPLREWLVSALEAGAAMGLTRKVALRLRLPIPDLASLGADDDTPLDDLYWSMVVNLEGFDLLDAVDAVLALQPVRRPMNSIAFAMTNFGFRVRDLEELLEHADSVYVVDRETLRLNVRVDPASADAYRLAVGSAKEDTARHLAAAWASAHSLRPDPDKAYDRAIKAVEAVACPLVVPKDPVPTLGKVLGVLRQSAGKWAYVLVDRDGHGSPGPIIEMMTRLWEGNRARHAGGPTSRAQTQAEAEAAVHIAVLLVQQLNAGALRQP